MQVIDIRTHRATLREPTEMDNAVPLREEFPAPIRTAEDDAYRAHAWRWILAVDALALVGFGVLVSLLRG